MKNDNRDPMVGHVTDLAKVIFWPLNIEPDVVVQPISGKYFFYLMPPTSKVIGLGLFVGSVCSCVRPSVTLCIRSRMVIDMILWNKHEK